MIYLIGSLRNKQVPVIAKKLRENGHEVFDDWYAAGPRADDHWKEYEEKRGHTYIEALDGFAAEHVYEYDKFHLDRCGTVVLVMPAGKSGHLEFGYAIGKGKEGYILLNDPDRWDVMYKFANGVFSNINDLLNKLKEQIRC